MSIYDSSKKLAGKLITKFANPNTLEFSSQVLVSDGMGGSVLTWADKFSCEGAVIPLSSGELLRSMQLKDESTHKAYIQHTSGTPLVTDKLTFGGVVYNVTGSLNVASADAVWTVFLKSGVIV